MLDNFWEAALAIGWKDMVDWKETPPTSRTSLLSSNSFAEASISASQYTPDTAGVDALLGAALGGLLSNGGRRTDDNNCRACESQI